MNKSQVSMRSGISKFGRSQRSNSKNSYASRKSQRFAGMSQGRPSKADKEKSMIVEKQYILAEHYWAMANNEYRRYILDDAENLEVADPQAYLKMRVSAFA